MATVEAFTREESKSGRAISFAWELAKLPSDSSREVNKRRLAVLSVTHHKAGPNYFSGESRSEDCFSVTLAQQTVADVLNGTGEKVGTVTSHMLFAGLGIAELPAGKRFSAKRLQEAADEALAIFTEHFVSGEEKVLRYFDPAGVS